MSDSPSIADYWKRFKAWYEPTYETYIAGNETRLGVCFGAGWAISFFALIVLEIVSPIKVSDGVATGLSVWGGVEAVLFHMNWWGRRPRPRLWLWVAVCFPLVCMFFGLAAVNAYDLWLRAEDYQRAGQAEAAAILFASLSLPVTAIAAVTVLMTLTIMPAGWAAFRRFQLMLLALVTLLGFPATGALVDRLHTADPAIDIRTVWPLVPVLMPIVGTFVLLTLVLVLGLCAAAIMFVFVTLPLMVFDYVERRANKAHIRAQKKAGLESYLLRFDSWLRHDQLPFMPDETKGARFALPEEIAQERRTAGFGFGHLGGDPLFLDTDKHVLLMASTRSGKGVTIIIPHLLRHQGSAFVLDPKGENARATGHSRQALNSRVHYLDPFGISGKPQSRFNPLASFDASNMEAGSKALAAALVMNEKRDHWTAAGQQLVAAIILHVVTSDSFLPAMKDLVTVRRLLLGALKPTLEEMLSNDAADGLVADLAASFLATPDKEFGSIASTAQRETEILDNPYIAACVAAAGDGSEVDFAEWHRGTMTVYLCLSAPKFPTFNRWLRLVLTSALDAMTDQLDPPPVPVCFMLDELATLGHLGAIENAVGLSAGYGIQLVAVFQDVAQMKDLYKGRWASFIGNAGVRILFNLDDYDTAKYWSDFLGGRLVGTMSASQDIYGLTKAQTAGEAMRPLLTPEEIMLRYAAGKMLILKQGMRPIEAERVPYWDDRWLDGLWRDPRVRPGYKPTAPWGTAQAAE